MLESQIKDGFGFFRKLTFTKIVNAAKIIGSYYISKTLKRPLHWGSPISIAIEPTTACNLRCPECPSGLRSFTRNTGRIQQDFFRNTIDQLAKTCSSLTFYFQGEPYLNPDFLQMVDYAHRKGLYTQTSTNGHFLTESVARQTVISGLDRIIISIDGVTQDTYESYRKNGQLAEVIAGTKRLVKWKQKLKSHKPYIIFQFLVLKSNEDDIPELYALARTLNVDEVRLKTAQLYDYKNGHPLMPSDERYSRYVRKADGSFRLKHRIRNQCWKMWHSAVITWDGIVVPCCFDKDATHQMGKLREVPFEEIWRSDKYHEFRSQILRGRKNIDICTNCTEGCSIWA